MAAIRPRAALWATAERLTATSVTKVRVDRILAGEVGDCPVEAASRDVGADSPGHPCGGQMPNFSRSVVPVRCSRNVQCALVPSAVVHAFRFDVTRH